MKLFISIAFSSRVLSDGSVEPAYRALMQRLIDDLRTQGHEVFCSLEYAGWKIGGDTSPEEEFQKDLEQIDHADKMIAMLEEKVSAGRQLELGYAYAKGKSVDIYQIGKPSWSNAAFAKLAGNAWYEVADLDDFARAVAEQYHHSSR